MNARTRFDLVAFNRYDQPVLAVEVNKKLDASVEWATQFYRNILSAGLLPHTDYFMFAFPDQFFLWKKAETESVEPSFVIDARPILAPYFEAVGVAPDKVSEHSLALIVFTWLNELINASEPHEAAEKSGQWLIESGLLEAVSGGRLQ